MKITLNTIASEVNIGDTCDLGATGILNTIKDIKDTKAQRKITWVDAEGRESIDRRGFNTTIIKTN